MEFSSWQSNRYKGNGKRINAYLDILQTKVYEAQRKLVDQGELVSTETLREIITGRNLERYLIGDEGK
jgi:hypothetical protein